MVEAIFILSLQDDVEEPFQYLSVHSHQGGFRMLRKTSSPVAFAFARSGGSIILARVDIWKATSEDWQLVASSEFRDATQPVESNSVPLPKGSYTGVFQCFVQESLNGHFRFSFGVGGKATFSSEGDVNTTPAKDDTKVFKDSFILEVK